MGDLLSARIYHKAGFDAVNVDSHTVAASPGFPRFSRCNSGQESGGCYPKTLPDLAGGAPHLAIPYSRGIGMNDSGATVM